MRENYVNVEHLFVVTFVELWEDTTPIIHTEVFTNLVAATNEVERIKLHLLNEAMNNLPDWTIVKDGDTISLLDKVWDDTPRAIIRVESKFVRMECGTMSM